MELAFLQDAVQDLVPRSAEAWTFATLAFTTLCGGVGWTVKRWADRRLVEATAEAKVAGETASRLALTQERLIESAERRELEANKRTDAAIAGLARLTDVVTEMSATSKTLAEEVRRGNQNTEYLMRERR